MNLRSLLVFFFIFVYHDLFSNNIVVFCVNSSQLEHHFGHLINIEEWYRIRTLSLEKQVICERGDDQNIFILERDHHITMSFESYLINHEISYNKILDIEYKEKYQDDINGTTSLLEKIWIRIPATTEKTLPRSIIKFIEWENLYNTAIKIDERHSPLVVKIEHFEIPLDVLESKNILEKNLAPSLSSNIYSSLIYEDKKSKQKFLRWPIHPEDGKYFKIFELYLRSNGIPFVKKFFFNGYLTASRSILLENPETHIVFSLKSSTNHTGGKWSDRPLGTLELYYGRRTSDYIKNYLNSHNKNDSFIPVMETATFSLPNINQGFSIREYPEAFINGNCYYLPAFAALHSQLGKEISKENENDKIHHFWLKHLCVSLALSLAELASSLGLSYDSPHMQQFLIELDQSFVPTGKIVFRDLSDTFALKSFVGNENSFFHENIDFSPTSNNYNDAPNVLTIFVRFFALIEVPNWIQDNHFSRLEPLFQYQSKTKYDNHYYDHWGRIFFSTFLKKFSEMTGIPLELMNKNYIPSGNFREKYKILKIKLPDFVK